MSLGHKNPKLTAKPGMKPLDGMSPEHVGLLWGG